MSRVDRDEVLASLTASDVAAQYGIAGRWGGRWMRSRSCGADHHGTAAFGLSTEGRWHCHACDEGGDLLALVARCERLDVRADFGRVLEVAAQIAGVDVDLEFGKPPPPMPSKPPPAPPMLELGERLDIARRRAAWIWERLSADGVARALTWRGLSYHMHPRALADVRLLGYRGTGAALVPPPEVAATDRERHALRAIYSTRPGYAVAVRHVETGELCDVRARAFEPPADAPKILGMPGGVTVDARRAGPDLVACYGWPHALERDCVVVVEGWADYLTAAHRWPAVDVLGAVDAGQYPLVASFAARYLAERGDAGLLVLVAQNDPAKLLDSGAVREGAADKAVNLASKRAIGLLGPERVRWIECAAFDVNDLNDLAQARRLEELPDFGDA